MTTPQTTPLEIKIALHYWSGQDGDYSSPFGKIGEMADHQSRIAAALQSFVDCGLLSPVPEPEWHIHNRKYRRGPALESFVANLLNVPLPPALDTCMSTQEALS